MGAAANQCDMNSNVRVDKLGGSEMTEDRSTERPVGSELMIPTGRMLYYPCSGRDFSQPIRTFANDVDTFWFADTSYLHRFPSGVERGRLQLPPIFEVVGHSKQNLRLPNGNEAPTIQIQWQHRRSERRVDAWFLAMDAVSVFRELQSARKPISVFWHRRDGTVEGGRRGKQPVVAASKTRDSWYTRLSRRCTRLDGQSWPDR